MSWLEVFRIARGSDDTPQRIKDTLGEIDKHIPCSRCKRHFKNYMNARNPQTRKELLHYLTRYAKAFA